MSARVEPHVVDAGFRAFVGDPRFPCLAGKGVVRTDGYALATYGALGSARSARALARDLDAFVASLADEGAALRAFVAVFPASPPADEHAFEARLWTQLRRLVAHDRGRPWDATVSADPEDGRFAFSFAERALFVVGIHAASSRIARRFAWPALVFNPHEQYERLRADGRFEPLRAAVREREIALQGTLNPNLADFGAGSEARQYSGRATEPEWRCPFHRTER